MSAFANRSAAPRSSRESFLIASRIQDRGVAVRLLAVADESEAIVESYATVGSAYLACLEEPVVRRLALPAVGAGQGGSRRLHSPSQSTIRWTSQTWRLPDEKRSVYESLQRWKRTGRLVFAKDASITPCPDDQLRRTQMRHIDRLSAFQVVSESRCDRANRPAPGGCASRMLSVAPYTRRIGSPTSWSKPRSPGGPATGERSLVSACRLEWLSREAPGSGPGFKGCHRCEPVP